MSKPPKDTSSQNTAAPGAAAPGAAPGVGAPDAQAAQAAQAARAAQAPPAQEPPKAAAAPAGEPLHRDAATGEKAEDVFRAFEKGRDDAVAAAARAAPGIKRAAAKGAYMFCYYLAFGVVYSAELAMTVVPEDSPIRHGFSDGAEAAKATHAQHKSASGLAQAA